MGILLEKRINEHNFPFTYYLLLYLKYRKLICNTKFIKNIVIFCYLRQAEKFRVFKSSHDSVTFKKITCYFYSNFLQGTLQIESKINY